jgi:hypothetical protein
VQVDRPSEGRWQGRRRREVDGVSLARLDRRPDAERLDDARRPRPGRDHDRLCRDPPPVGDDRPHGAVPGLQADDGLAEAQLGAARRQPCQEPETSDSGRTDRSRSSQKPPTIASAREGSSARASSPERSGGIG